MLWSMVSKAAEISRRQRQETCWWVMTEISLSRMYPAKASLDYPKLTVNTRTSCHQIAQASPYHSHHQIIPLVIIWNQKAVESAYGRTNDLRWLPHDEFMPSSAKLMLVKCNCWGKAVLRTKTTKENSNVDRMHALFPEYMSILGGYLTAIL